MQQINQLFHLLLSLRTQLNLTGVLRGMNLFQSALYLIRQKQATFLHVNEHLDTRLENIIAISRFK